MANYTYIEVRSVYVGDNKYEYPAIDVINTYLSKGYAIGPAVPSGGNYLQILYKPQLNELEQAQLRELKRQEDWSPESLAAGTADPRLVEARNRWKRSSNGAPSNGALPSAAGGIGGTRKNKRAKRSKRTRRV